MSLSCAQARQPPRETGRGYTVGQGASQIKHGVSTHSVGEVNSALLLRTLARESSGKKSFSGLQGMYTMPSYCFVVSSMVPAPQQANV